MQLSRKSGQNVRKARGYTAYDIVRPTLRPRHQLPPCRTKSRRSCCHPRAGKPKGRLNLICRAVGHPYEISDCADFWQVMVDRYGLSIDITGGSFETLPASGPPVIVSNHPYDILDGPMMGHILSDAQQGVLEPCA